MNANYTTAAQDAQSIRTSLKQKYGWTSRDVSVKSRSFAVASSSIDVKIKRAGIRADLVKDIAEDKESIRRDGFGEILSGCNRFVTVTFDYDLLNRKAQEILPLVKVLTPHERFCHTFKVGTETFIVHRQSPNDWRYTCYQEGKGYLGCQSDYDVAHILAQSSIEQGNCEVSISN